MTPEQTHQALEMLTEFRYQGSMLLKLGPDSSLDAIRDALERCDRLFGEMCVVTETDLPDDVALFTDPKTGAIVGMIYNIGHA